MTFTAFVRRFAVLAAPVAVSGIECPPALAAGTPSLDALGPHAGWMLLAGIGLAAVVVGAFAVRLPGRERRSLMEATTELREAPPELSGVEPEMHPVTPSAMPAEAAADAMAPSLAAASRVPEAPSIGATSPRPVQTPPVVRDEEPGAARLREPKVDAAIEGSQLFLALHHVDLSIDVLKRHLEQESRPMPAVWLMLLDLARTHGREQSFRELAQEFHRRFNARMPSWDGYPPDCDEPGLEAYPRLVKEITLAWGTHECRRLLDRLLYDNRSGNRKGFTLNAYNDLVTLRRAAEAVTDTIEQDLAEEAKIRSVFASATADIVSDDVIAREGSPLVRDLESELDRDLGDVRDSALEREHPALARMLAREWGNAALAARLCEMLARGGDGTHSLSKEAAEDLETLRSMAERLAAPPDTSARDAPSSDAHPQTPATVAERKTSRD